MVLIILSIVYNIVPMVILPLFYKKIPDNIPAFVDLSGNTVVSMEKSYISIIRLPFMGILLSVVCIIMYSMPLNNENKKFNKIIWPVISFIVSLKMGITSLEIIFYENMEIIKYFRISVLILVIIGITILVYGLIKMYKNKIPFMEYKNRIHKNKIIITGIIIAYIITALMPVYLK
ncbi:MAG: hypothetical protein LBD55_06495 [Treponema sp.]|jgi:hypothetical protein|nr:hypothetical protein [Treponema sp.]